MSHDKTRPDAEPHRPFETTAGSAAIPGFLRVSALGGRIAAHDWPATPLGPIEGWPQSLKTTLALVLRSPVPMALLWGEAGTMLYNDGYAAIIGRRHPDALGAPVREAWPEIVDFNDRVMRTVLAGETLSYEDQELVLDREGRFEPAFFDLDYSPVVDEAGRAVGVLAVVTETTGRVLAERRREAAEAGLERREAHWRALFEELREGLILGELVRDGAGRATDWAYLEVNPAFGRLVGMAPEDAIGRTVRAVFPGIEEIWIEHMVGVVEAGQPAAFVDRVGTLDRWYEGHVFPLGGDRFAVMFVEATERLATEQRLSRDRQRLETALRVARLGTFEWTIATGALDFDARSREIYGLPAEGPLSVEEIFARIVPEAVERVRTETMAAFSTGDRAEFAYDVMTLGGERRSIDAMGYVVETNGDLRMIGVLADVTELKRAEAFMEATNEALERQVEARTRERDRLWRASRDMLAVADAGGVLLSVNPAWTRLLGWSEGELVGRTLEGLRHPDDVERGRAELARLAAGEATAGFEERLRTRDAGYRILSWTAASEAGLVYMVARDVTAERERAEALAVAEEALRQSQKMEAVGQLTGGIAHDFNNLLGAVMSGFELILRRPEDTGRVHRIAEQGLAAVQRGAKLTGQLLAFSRAQRIELRPVAVAAVVEEMREMLARTLGPMVRLELALDDAGARVLSDPVQLEMSVLNLAINARDAMAEGGTLTIASCARRVDGDAELDPGAYVELSVADTGVGMAPEVAARAFDPFYTTKGVGQGTGLGLAQVYGIARSAGGTARIESIPERGTIVRLLLPLRHDEAPAEEGAGPGTEAAIRLEKRHVLVVDDDEGFRGMLVEALRDLGCMVTEAADGAAGLAALEASAFDLMVVDFAMPGMTGAEVAAAASVRHPALPILFASGYANTAAIEAVAGADAPILRKPFGVEELRAALDAVLHR